jgi:hypothetical protein
MSFLGVNDIIIFKCLSFELFIENLNLHIFLAYFKNVVKIIVVLKKVFKTEYKVSHIYLLLNNKN